MKVARKGKRQYTESIGKTWSLFRKIVRGNIDFTQSLPQTMRLPQLTSNTKLNNQNQFNSI